MLFGEVSIVSWSKDSIYVSWHFNTDHAGSNQTELRGYRIRYQAVGSSVVQYTRLIDRSVSYYEITHLHENTNYEICVLVVETASRPPKRTTLGTSAAAMHSGLGEVTVGGPPALSAVAVACVTGSTSTDSLSVALGSTFGAFLALGFIVALVFLAKWQHSRRLAKQFAGLPLDDVHVHMSAITLPHDHSFGTHTDRQTERQDKQRNTQNNFQRYIFDICQSI